MFPPHNIAPLTESTSGWFGEQQIGWSTLLVNIATDVVAVDVIVGIVRARVLAVVFQSVTVTVQSSKATLQAHGVASREAVSVVTALPPEEHTGVLCVCTRPFLSGGNRRLQASA